MAGFQPKDEFLPPGKDCPESYLTLLLPYGSYYLGVNARDGDIDCVVLLPKFVGVSEFVSLVPSYLLTKHPQIRFYEVVQSHNANLVTLQYGDVYIDLQPVVVDVDRIDSSVDVLDDYILHGLSDQAVRALNGVRTNVLIKRALKDSFTVFRETLMLLKLFVKRRGLSGNKTGFFGGINLSLLLANMFVKAKVPRDASLIRCLYSFLTIYSLFPWEESFVIPTPGNRIPDFNCTLLSADEADKPHNQGVRHLDSAILRQQWRPLRAPMTILTLAPPVMNSSMKVYPCSRRTICRELAAGRGRLLRALLAAQEAFKLVSRAGTALPDEGGRSSAQTSEPPPPGPDGAVSTPEVSPKSAIDASAVLRPCLFSRVFAPVEGEFFTDRAFRNNYLCIRLSLKHLGRTPTFHDRKRMEKAVSLADSRLIGVFLALQRQCQITEAAETAEAVLREAQLESEAAASSSVAGEPEISAGASQTAQDGMPDWPGMETIELLGHRQGDAAKQDPAEGSAPTDPSVPGTGTDVSENIATEHPHHFLTEAHLTFFRPLPHWFGDEEMFSPENIANRGPNERYVNAWHFTGLCISPGDSSIALQRAMDRMRLDFLEGLKVMSRTCGEGAVRDTLQNARVEIIGRSELPERLRFSKRGKGRRSK